MSVSRRITDPAPEAGRELAPPPDAGCQKAADHLAASKYVPGEREWPALLRLLDREEATFRELAAPSSRLSRLLRQFSP